MTPQRVVHLITRLDHGGSAQNTLLTALGHDRAAFAPIVVAGTAEGWEDQGGTAATEANRARLEAAGVPCHLLPSLSRPVRPLADLAALRRVTRLLEELKPALLHTHTSKAGVLGRLAARRAGIDAVVHTPHGHVFYGHFGPAASRICLAIERALARRTTRLIALTEAERDEHLARGVGAPARFAVVPSGIDLDRFRASVGVRTAAPAALSWPADAIVVGSVGWLTPVKGHRYLIEAVARARSRIPRLHLLLVGNGARRDELAALAARSGLGGAVTFAGERRDVPACLAAMDVFVLPSLNEGMGRALIEAMAAGRPVIASRVGGVPALIEHRRTGLLVPPADAGTLAEALTEVVTRPQWGKELGAAAALSIGERFSARSMVRAVEAVYREALTEVGA